MARTQKTPKALPRHERETTILLQIAVMQQKSGVQWYTVADIARGLGLSASTKLRLMCNDLVAEGELITFEESMPGIAGKRRLYALPTEKQPIQVKRERSVVVNHRGKREQVSLW